MVRCLRGNWSLASNKRRWKMNWHQPDFFSQYGGDSPALFIDPQGKLAKKGGARQSDPATSHKAASCPNSIMKWASNKHLLLLAFDKRNLTDEQAEVQSGVRIAGYWKRCSELRALGLIEPSGKTEIAKTGKEVMVSRITPRGREVLQSIKENKQ